NFFWYLKDPAGNFSEYYADMDCIVDDQLWTPSRRAGSCSGKMGESRMVTQGCHYRFPVPDDTAGMKAVVAA
ncbi:MAG TPA: hypothetical protein VHT94_01040, partial [Streptosporangiaceae bacterium]|nr:hypothetical protein [Streptosporangiaceae bacterium]